MPSKIEDYAIIGDTKTVALVDLGGSIDWWCAPRIDSGAAFAALLGDADNGRWLIAPKGEVTNITRHYEPETLILETIFETSTGSVSVSDFMPPNEGHSMIHRIVEGRSGTVEMEMELTVRYEYGAVTPWATATGDGLVLVAARDGLRLHSAVPLVGNDNTTGTSFSVSVGTRRSFSLSWFPSVTHAPLPIDSLAARNHTRHYWHDWVGRCTYKGGSRDLVVRSLITLKALIFEPSGAVCAAATTSLPETVGGNRNWDYRYSWLRDATFTPHALLVSGYTDEAAAWVGWLRRAVAGTPGEMQIMYGVDGERRLPEFELDHLAGYEGSTPVRIGNEAVTQLQLDVYGEVLDAAVTYWQSPIPKDSNGRASRLLAEAHASPARVAEHLLATAPAGDGWVVEQLRAAAQEAAARGAPESGAAYLRRALTEPPPPEVRADLLLELGRAEFSAGQPDWHHHLEEAVESAADDTTRTGGRAGVRECAAFPSRSGRGGQGVRWRRRPARQPRPRGPSDVGGYGRVVWTAP